MLYLVAYDISDPKRLQRVANLCADHGVRVQKSLFECWLEEREFEALWASLARLSDPRQDRVVAYRLDLCAEKHRRTVGEAMVCTEASVCQAL